MWTTDEGVSSTVRTFLVKVKTHMGKPLHEGTDCLAEAGHTLEREGENYSKTIRNTSRRGVTESLLEERLHFGANKWWKGLFEGSGEDMEEEHVKSKQNWKFTTPDKWDKITSGKWIQKTVW